MIFETMEIIIIIINKRTVDVFNLFVGNDLPELNGLDAAFGCMVVVSCGQ